jgi:hypothetical protein
MCRSLVSVDWQGWLYDCDFNQQLDLPLGTSGVRRHLRDLLRGPICRRSRFACPDIATAAPRAKAAAAAVRWRTERACPKLPWR